MCHGVNRRPRDTDFDRLRQLTLLAFVKRPLGLAEGGVRGGHELPIKQLKPRPFHAAA
jgi:hypothetical protein